MINLSSLFNDIRRLNELENKTVAETFLKFNEEFGEFSAEVVKLLGLSYKPYDREHFVEEEADALQCLFSIFLNLETKTGIDIEEIFEKILEKNKKWEEKLKLYTKNEK